MIGQMPNPLSKSIPLSIPAVLWSLLPFGLSRFKKLLKPSYGTLSESQENGERWQMHANADWG